MVYEHQKIKISINFKHGKFWYFQIATDQPK